jgi:Arc/MetJ family transcription regulator
MKINIEIDEEHVQEALEKLELLDKLWADIIEIRAMTEEVYDLVKASARKN